MNKVKIERSKFTYCYPDPIGITISLKVGRRRVLDSSRKQCIVMRDSNTISDTLSYLFDNQHDVA